ncbi:MAG TPA: MarR family winged helix-turn-helix transcriptional regulator [Feifaniaceae bacterium]|nr:MarR family winged helix-turn-helix transcriptional regulator [Feifaniaceae bacterium]
MHESSMDEPVSELYKNLRLVHYRNLFTQLQEKAGSLSATEAFSAEVIYLLDHPTISEFAAFLGISQPNASYKVNALVTKGYLERVGSDDDRREAHLNVTRKFLDYYGRQMPDVSSAVSAALESFTQAEAALLFKLFGKLNRCLAAKA